MLRKVCLRTGPQRHSSRARPSPHANTSRRPLRAVLLRKVSNIIMTAEVSSQHFHGENTQNGAHGTALTHPTGRLERARSTGVTNDKDGAANVSVKKPDPPHKVVTRARFS